MTGCPCTYSAESGASLHDGHCCYDPRGPEIPPSPEPLPCGHDDSAIWPGHVEPETER